MGQARAGKPLPSAFDQPATHRCMTGLASYAIIKIQSKGAFMRHVVLGLVTAGLMTGVSFADSTVVYDAEGGGMTIETRGDDVRLTPDGGGAYLILRDGKAYSVVDQGGQTIVMDMAALAQSMGRGGAQTNGAPEGRETSIERTGRTETIAGIEGEVVRVSSADGESVEVVMTDNQAVVDATDGLLAFADAMTQGMGGQMGGGGSALPSDALSDLKGFEGGILRAGDEMRVTSVDANAPAAARFELPAEPVSSMQDMMRMMQNQN